MSDHDAACAHIFCRIRTAGFFARRDRYECIHCGLLTRGYDSIDRVMTRPVHPHMSVAVRGYNTL